MTASTRPSLVDYRNNGVAPKPTFSAPEMQRRQDNIRGWMAKSSVDACLFTSYHNICYLSDFLYCYFGRKYGLVITQAQATSVTAAIDGGQPARRTFGYGHSFGVLCHYYGREGGLELREDCDTVLEPGMVISMESMIMIPEGQKGAGGNVSTTFW
jgi:Xaa-Pro aminopeptidase